MRPGGLGRVACDRDAVAGKLHFAQRLARQKALLRRDDVGPRRKYPAGNLKLVVVEEATTSTSTSSQG